MAIIRFIRERIIRYGRLKTYLVAVTLISAIVYIAIAAWYAATFFDLLGAFKDIHNCIVDLLKICGFVCRALSLSVLFVFFVRDYGKRTSSKFMISLLFLFMENIFTLAYFVFNSVWNSIEYLSRSEITTGITLRLLVFIFFLISLYGLYRQSKKDFASSFKKVVLLLLFIVAVGAIVYIDYSRVYGRINVSSLVFYEIAGFIVYSPYILNIAFGKMVYRRAKAKAAAKKKRTARREPKMNG